MVGAVLEAIVMLCANIPGCISVVAILILLIIGATGCFTLDWVKRGVTLYFSPLRKIPSGGVQFLRGITAGSPDSNSTNSIKAAYRLLSVKSKLILGYHPFGHAFVLTYDPDIVRWVLLEDSTNWASKGNVRGRQMAIALLGGSSMIFAEGETHRRHRLIGAAAFRPAMLRQYVGSIHHGIRNLISEWKTGSQNNDCIEVRHGLGGFAFAVVSEIVFGERIKTSDETNELASCYHSIMGRGTHDTRFNTKNRSFSFWHYLPIPPIINLLWQLRRLHQLVDAKIADRRSQRNALAKSSRPQCHYLDTLLLAHEDGRLSLSEAHDEMLTLLLAGHETVSTSVGWILLLLAQNPKVQAIAAEEAFAIIGSASSDVELTWKTFERLTYIAAVVQETLRLYSTIMATQRVNKEEVELSGYKIPKNTPLVLHFAAMHRNEDIWGPDADLFRPERFLNDVNIPWKAWMPFGEGPHKCLGYRLAMLEMVLAIAMLLREFTFDPDMEGSEIRAYYLQIIVVPHPPIKLRIRQRQRLPMDLRMPN